MSDSTIKNPIGHPSLYREEYCQHVVELGRQGMSFVEIADELDVSPKTLRNWRNRYPEFAAAMELAKRSDQAFWERLIRGIALGEVKGNVVAVTKSLQCRFKHDWTERQEVTGSDGGPVEKVTRIELVGRELPDDHPALAEDKRRAATVIDIQANQPAGPRALPEPAASDHLGDESSNMGETVEPEPMRSATELLYLFDNEQDQDFTKPEWRLFNKAFRERAKQQEHDAIQAEQERIARQAQQRLMLPGGIGGKRRNWAR